MPMHRLRVALIAFLAALNLAALVFLVFVWYPRWHQKIVARAMTASEPPAFWWPPSWRRELRTSFLLEGGTLAIDPMKRPGDGVVELETEADGRVFRTDVIPSSKGRFSFGDRLLPVGPFRVRLITPDGRLSAWIRVPEIDPGRHSMNWRFTFEGPPRRANNLERRHSGGSSAGNRAHHFNLRNSNSARLESPANSGLKASSRAPGSRLAS